jgi:hypothetical protein
VPSRSSCARIRGRQPSKLTRPRNYVRRSIPDSARRTSTYPSPAISSFGRFRTPVAGVRGIARARLANLRNLSAEVRTLGNALREIKAGENTPLQSEIAQLKEALTLLNVSVDRLGSTRSILTDEAIEQSARTVIDALMNLRDCSSSPRQGAAHRTLGNKLVEAWESAGPQKTRWIAGIGLDPALYRPLAPPHQCLAQSTGDGLQQYQQHEIVKDVDRYRRPALNWV